MIRLAFAQTAATAALLAIPLALAAAPSRAGDASPAAVASPEVYTILAENEQFRVLEAKWQPGQEDAFHSHPGDRVSIFVTDCKLRITKPDGTFRESSRTGGTAVARTGKPVPAHKTKNIGDDVCIIRIVEVK